MAKDDDVGVGDEEEQQDEQWSLVLGGDGAWVTRRGIR